MPFEKCRICSSVCGRSDGNSAYSRCPVFFDVKPKVYTVLKGTAAGSGIADYMDYKTVNQAVTVCKIAAPKLFRNILAQVQIYIVPVNQTAGSDKRTVC